MLLVIDNYDSFVFNLARYFQRLGQETLVVRNDALDVAGVRALKPQGIVLSPGPCTPNEAGCSLELVRELHTELPLLGVCLGHQTIAAALGASIVRAAQPMHGRASEIMHAGSGIFAGLTRPLVVGRYHSLTVEESSLPSELEVTSRAEDGTIMALAHRRWPVFGVQFHPESILTARGHDLLANWLRLAGLQTPAALPTLEDERLPVNLPPSTPTPDVPVTF